MTYKLGEIIKYTLVFTMCICSITTVYSMRQMPRPLAPKPSLDTMQSTRRSSSASLGNSTIVSSEGKTIPLASTLIAPQDADYIVRNKAQLDHKLSARTWPLIFKLQRANRLYNGEKQFLFHTNPFDETEEPEKLIGRLQFLSLKDPLVDAILECYVLFTNGKVNSKALLSNLEDLDQPQRESYRQIYLVKLDKYTFLNFGRHIDFPQDLCSTVSLEELLQYEKVELPLSEESQARDNSATNNHSLILCNKSLAHLSGWQHILQSINTNHIYQLDLSNNSLRDLGNLCLTMPGKSFGNLRELYLAHNKLKNVPGNLLKGCTLLVIIDLSYNPLDECSADDMGEFVAPCTKLQKLLLAETSMEGTLTARHFSPHAALYIIDCTGSEKLHLSTDLQQKIKGLNVKLNPETKSWILGSFATRASLMLITAIIVTIVVCRAKASMR